MPQLPSVGEAVTATFSKLTPVMAPVPPVIGGFTAQWAGVFIGAGISITALVIKTLVDIYFKRKHYRLALAQAGWKGDEP